MSLTVIADTREQTPWTFECAPSFKVVRRKLDTGDYSIDGLEHRVCIERKSIDDWIGTVLRDRQRFYRELDRMRAFDFRCVIIEAGVREIMAGSYRSNASPASVMGFVAEVAVAQSVPVYLAGSRPEAQELAAVLLKAARKSLVNAPASRGDG